SDDALSNFYGVTGKTRTLFDLLGEHTVVIIDEPQRVYEIAELNQREFEERFKSLYSDGAFFSFQSENFSGLENLIENIKKHRVCGMQNLSTAIRFFNPLKIINPQCGGVIDYQLDFKEVFTDIENWVRTGYSVTVCTATAKRADDLRYELSIRNLGSSINSDKPLGGIQISTEKLSRGFIFHEEKAVLLGSGNLYAKPTVQKRLKSKKQVFFSAPETGDYCVHETHGVGRVLGSKKISSTEGTKDYVAVEYAGGDILYVPVEQMDILTRYLGSEKKPRLSKIGGKDFERIKNNVKESIKKMSFDLKQLYRERDEMKGFKFQADDELQKVFESSFPFEDTPDQALANEDIEKDMTSGKVMDRLVCGDVGFGKTEVAFRAVFRAIINGKQAVMLAPTTILAEQHFNTACERFKDFGIKIACLNRFKSPKQQKQILESLKKGEIEFIIGTHRLLSKDVEFKDLGLLVLDEEQRFGVEHKEKIKTLKKNVDAITLTATPIPRTLHMSLSGIRSISTINTPPKKRLPVQTYVTEQTDTLIKDAVTREVNRGGQTFILYNRVESIFNFADRVRALMPDLKITVVHGQMDEKVLENSIMAFYRGESDVLISTTIIENGIDLPKANTLIVIDADKLGLSTLYQLKGRVGRSDRLAYAYFTFQRDKILTDTAFERLNAIVDFTEMGSGIKIAMRDLEIRGAGNILGAEQHGHMDKIGYELYSKLLKEELTGVEEVVPELDIRVTAYIPDAYMESNTKRMDAYKEIAELSSKEEELEFVSTVTEAYGPFPKEAENLLNIAMVKALAMKFKVSKITVTKSLVGLEFSSLNALADKRLGLAMQEFSDTVWLNMAEKPVVEFKRDFMDNSAMLKTVREFLAFASGN
ncbi:MAG: transcription-repair coupling factor, partial [Clostridia bacterium]|nr:transcription-repair coupling factor [Clostridia bacterium]